MADCFFESVAPIALTPKPRTNGLTMMIDWDMGPRAQEDFLAMSADYFDFAKIPVGVGRLLSREILAAKIRGYQERGIEPFPGGQFLEYAHVHGTEAAYFPAVAEAGYRWCEVSDNLAEVSLAWKQQSIRRAVEEFGINIFGEVGKKEGLVRGQSMVDDAMGCQDAGASIILLEAAEIISDDPAIAKEVEQVVAAVGLEKTMFELSGPWIQGVHLCDIHQMRRDLIARFGPEVNLGNVACSDVLPLAALRCGLGVNAGSAVQH